MSTDADQIYQMLFEREVVSSDEIVAVVRSVLGRDVSRDYAFRRYATPLIRSGKLRRIRRGLYYAPDNRRPYANTDLVACSLRKSAFLGYQDAAELWGAVYFMTTSRVKVCVSRKDRFKPFIYGPYEYIPVIVRDFSSVVASKKGRGLKKEVRLTNRLRTFIDCVKRPDLVGGWGGVYNTLGRLRGVDLDQLREEVIRSGNQMLIRKVGMILELVGNDFARFDEAKLNEVLDDLERRVTSRPMRLTNCEYEIRFNEPWLRDLRWNLYRPPRFEVIVRGRVAMDDPIMGLWEDRLPKSMRPGSA
ncbi:MAG: hypothetical protein HXY34_06850 [Candidatus Thorarchaeota archaeon]|nr:hypothetical protein [Candidatus Thorarchaeota archaeon]